MALKNILHFTLKNVKHIYGTNITFYFQTHNSSLRSYHNSYTNIGLTALKSSTKFLSHRHFSRIPKSWFRTKTSTFDIVDLCEVGPKRHVPNHIQRPPYVDTGIDLEQTDEVQILDCDSINSMRKSCSIARAVLDEVSRSITVGVTTDELDAVAHDACISFRAYPSPLNYKGFPKSICTSVNNIACHGIPDNRKLRDGDVISVDVSVYYNGFHGDCASTYCVGNIDIKAHKLIEVAELCLHEAIYICRHGQDFSTIGKTISKLAQHQGFSVIPAFCGHGIGTSFHCPPNILHYDNELEGKMLKGMIFTIEPVICEGRPDILILEDGWTAATEDDSRSAQFEHTILITENAAEILTLSSDFRTL